MNYLVFSNTSNSFLKLTILYFFKIFNHKTKSSFVFKRGNKQLPIKISFFTRTEERPISQDFNNSFILLKFLATLECKILFCLLIIL